MTALMESFGMVAPYYNLGMVLVVVYLFLKLFKTYQPGKHVYVRPWVYIFIAVCIYIVEELLTVLRKAGIITIKEHINGFFELAMIIMFIYGFMLQKEYIREQIHKRTVARPVSKKVKKKAKSKKKS